MRTPYVDQQPDFFAVTATSAPAAIDMGAGIWCSPGMSNAYLVTTGDGVRCGCKQLCSTALACEQMTA